MEQLRSQRASQSRVIAMFCTRDSGVVYVKPIVIVIRHSISMGPIFRGITMSNC